MHSLRNILRRLFRDALGRDIVTLASGNAVAQLLHVLAVPRGGEAPAVSSARQTALGLEGTQSIAEGLVAHAQCGAQGAMGRGAWGVGRGAIVVQNGEEAFGQRRLTRGGRA